MTDSSEAEVPPQTNGISDSLDDEERAKIRPVDIDADVKEMERRKRVDVIMNSKMFREELERIIETQLKDGYGTSGLMQQISDMMGVNKQAGNVFKHSNCVVPINDIRGIEAMGYGKGEKILRCKLAAVFRLIDLYGWTQSTNTLVTARLNQDEEHFLVNPYGMMFHEVTASSLIKVAMQGNVIEQGTTNFSVNISAFSLHAAVHAARPDIKCIINVHTPSVIAISALKHGILPLSQESVVIGEVSTHTYLGGLLDPEEKDKLARNLGPNNKVLLLTNQGALCCGETIEEAFFNARNTVLACESQLKLIPVGIDNLILLNDEIKKKMYDAAHIPPESTPRPDQPSILEGKVERKWRVGGIEFEALMRMLDNAGFRTGYIYRHPLIKGEPPKPKNDVEVPPAVSSLGYLLEEEELYRQGLWKKLEGGRKGHDRSRWLNSPNVYQKVEILETGTPDPKKITKWVADGSPTHSSTPVKIDSALQFVPKGTNPKEFKQKQQQIKDYRRADKISAGPQSHILEGVTWEEARKMQDATVTQTGDQVVLMGAASKGIIQRGHQHNAMVYKSPYAKNPFDSVTDEELDEYKKVVEKKVKGEYDTDYSESEGLSSTQNNKKLGDFRSPTSVTSETEEESRDEPQVLRIETKHAPRPSQPEVVLSDVESSATEQFLRAERVSVGSYNKSTNMVKGQHTHRLFQLPYRTNSFAGLPKGSYCIPNPLHFHVVRQTNIAQPARPILIKTGPQTRASHYIFNQFKFNCDSRNQTVTINIGNIRTVSLAMSIQTVRDFIHPFADALNMLNLPNLNNQASQTSYVTDKKISCDANYTPLVQSCTASSPLLVETSQHSQFETQILQKLQDNLFADLTCTDSEYSDLDLQESFEQGTQTEETQAILFDENFIIKNNESMVEFADIPNNLVNDVFSSDDKNSRRGLLEDFNEFERFQNSSLDSVDEGICDISNLAIQPTNPNNFSESDERTIKFGQIIFEYLAEQGFENSELLIFPEISCDINSAKFFSKLLSIYNDMFRKNLNYEEKNEFRFKVCSYLIDLFENDERLFSSNDSLNSQITSDKVFSFSETVSAILDHFFDLIDANKQEEKFQNLSMNDYEILEEITSFKKDQSKISGNEAYWITIGSPSSKRVMNSSSCRKIVNIDDIPIAPSKSVEKFRSLSPIPEEFNRNASIGLQIGGPDKKSCTNTDVLGSGDNEKVDEILSGHTASYVAFEKPESNIVVCNGVSFYRTVTTNTMSYVKTSNVSFKVLHDTPTGESHYIAEDNSDVCDYDSEGDWMGYEKAKF